MGGWSAVRWMLFTFLTVVVVHELGHIGVAVVFGRRVVRVEWGLWRIGIVHDGPDLSPWRFAAISAAGPSANIGLAVLVAFIAPYFGMATRSGPWVMASALTGLIHLLLPFSWADGARCLRFIREGISQSRSKQTGPAG